jgi:flavin reductase
VGTQIAGSGSTASADEVTAAFKAAMRRFASTVTIVTVRSGNNHHGMTATAITSVTADPPAVLACVNRSASIHANLRLGMPFCINLLSSEHRALSSAFGGGLSPERRFSQGLWQLESEGPPYLIDAQANLFCIVDTSLDYGTHTIFVGRVEAVRLHGSVQPLIYGDGRFI